MDHAELQGRGGARGSPSPAPCPWTPGNWTTIRLSPWRWMTGSATPSSFTAVAHVVTFCCTAKRSTSSLASSRALRRAPDLADVFGRFDDQLGHPPGHQLVGLVTVPGVVEPDDQPAVGAHRDRALTELLLSQQGPEVAGVALLRLRGPLPRGPPPSGNAQPPRRSRPRYIGNAPRPASQPGVAGARFRCDDVPAGELVFDDLPGLELVFPRCEPDEDTVGHLGPLRGDGRPSPADSTSRPSNAASAGAPRTADTCTAGSSPKTLGSAKTMPQRSTTTRSAYLSTPDTG